MEPTVIHKNEANGTTLRQYLATFATDPALAEAFSNSLILRTPYSYRDATISISPHYANIHGLTLYYPDMLGYSKASVVFRFSNRAGYDRTNSTVTLTDKHAKKIAALYATFATNVAAVSARVSDLDSFSEFLRSNGLEANGSLKHGSYVISATSSGSASVTYRPPYLCSGCEPEAVAAGLLEDQTVLDAIRAKLHGKTYR